MAENHENPWPDEHEGRPHADPSPGDLPSDFFDELSEPVSEGEPRYDAPPPTDLGPAPVAGDPYDDAPGAPETETYAEVPPVYDTPEERPVPPPDMGEDAQAPVFPMILGALMLVAMVTAVFFSARPAPTPATPPTAAGEPATPPAPTPTDTVAADLKALRGDLDGVAKQVKDLEGKIAALPKPAPAVDLAPLTSRVDALAKSVDAVKALPDRLARLDERVGGFDGALKKVDGRLGELGDAVKKASADAAAAKDAASKPAPYAAGSTEPKPAGEPKPAADPAAAALAAGAGQFKAGNYPQAAETFKKAVDAGAKDARVFYYAALSRGITTNEWTGETQTLLSRGIELEKSGAPKTPEIDAAFAGLPQNMKAWLDGNRAAGR